MTSTDQDRRHLRRMSPEEARASAPAAVDPQARAIAQEIVAEVRAQGAPALRRYAERFGDIEPGAPLWLERADLQAALESIEKPVRALLERTAARIAAFAAAQRASLQDLTFPIPGGLAGHRFAPVESAGCYAPGGRYPLPSSVLMTAVTARTAGVENVTVASPRPAPITLAAAAVAGAERLLCAGGAQAVAALACGTAGARAVDVLVGPGNRYVTAAKQEVSGGVGIDMLAGPSELLVIADRDADATLVAADLLAQAEHDPDARPLLIALDGEVLDAVECELERGLQDLPTASIARAALKQGCAVLCANRAQACRLADRLAPEHLALHVREPEAWRTGLNHMGALFLGAGCAEVLGDYGAGPNHVLPTGGSARYDAGLSVKTFLRMQTWMRIDEAAEARGLYEDAAALARLEGLHAHARAAEARL